MYSSYFDRLAEQARRIEGGILRLRTTWNQPRLLVRGRECTSEVNKHVAILWNSIKSTQEQVTETLLEIQETAKMDEFLHEHMDIYSDLKSQCDELETVFMEYSYSYDTNGSLNQNMTSENKSIEMLEDYTEPSLNEVHTPGSNRKQPVPYASTPLNSSLFE